MRRSVGPRAAVQNAAENAAVIGERSDIVVLGISRGDRLWIEIVRIDEIGVLGADVERRGDNLFGRQNQSSCVKELIDSSFDSLCGNGSVRRNPVEKV